LKFECECDSVATVTVIRKGPIQMGRLIAEITEYMK